MHHRAMPSCKWLVDCIAYPAGSSYGTPTQAHLASLLLLDMDRAIEYVNSKCHQCASSRNVPHVIVDQSAGDPPDAVSVTFAAVIVKRAQQLILVVRDCAVQHHTPAWLRTNATRPHKVPRI